MNIARANQLKISGPNGSKYYGGNQEWFSSNTWAMGGCGSVAGANALRCLARTNSKVKKEIAFSKKIPSEIKSSLCTTTPSKENFSYLMTGMYKSMPAFELFPLNRVYDQNKRGDKIFSFIRPNFGLTNTGFIIGIIRYAHRIGLNIKVNSLPTAFCSSDKARDFIKKGLDASGSVVLLTSYNKHNLYLFPSDASLDEPLEGYKVFNTDMKCHFATITDIDDDRLLITTWARPAIGSYSEIAKSWHSIKGFQSTLMYIEPSSRQDSCKCILHSWKPFVYATLQCLTRRFLYKE